ncbi:hypothetical protein [Nocardia gipuzkoensis]|uniref:hypothetical protein n=1 Tax=Nocardia gipuzkoensis TaxID=2749991 RepID=UPI00237EC199|nr:hypothetical protein [Nocardia gipuzkoensis]MDE1668837.1 hypothetical protein [Nocardia gipuzkoensis]
MPRPKRSPVGAEATGLRAVLIEREERRLERLEGALVRAPGDVCLYDFGPEAERTAARLKLLRAGRPVQVHRFELPRSAVDGLAGRLFELRGERLSVAEYERIGD